MADVDPKTVNNLLTDMPDPKSNPTAVNLRKIAKALGVEAWMLLIENFPFEEIAKPSLKHISADGYALLNLYESATEEKRASLLDYMSYQLRGSAAESKVRDVQSRYLTPTAVKYKKCEEDFN